MRQRRPAIAGRREFDGPERKAPPPTDGGGPVGASLGGDCFRPFLLQPMQIIDGAPRVRGGGTAGLAGAAALAPRGAIAQASPPTNTQLGTPASTINTPPRFFPCVKTIPGEA